MGPDLAQLQHTVGRYLLFGQIGAGGMAAVHVGRRVGAGGFSRLVAIKRMHPHLAEQRTFVNAFLDEARIAARVNHPNVVSIDDVVVHEDEVLLVMEYVHGCSLSRLQDKLEQRGSSAFPPGIAVSIAVELLHGLHAAHSARDERGRELGLIHRDVSPQNVLIGADGVARVLDFGIAKALGRLQSTETGALKGKLAYMAPERFTRDDRQSTIAVDVFGAAVTIWEMFAGRRYYGATTHDGLLAEVISAWYPHLPNPDLATLDAILERALSRDPNQRHTSCAELADAIERAVPLASRRAVIDWIQDVIGDELAESSLAIEEVERSSMGSIPTVAVGSGTHERPSARRQERTLVTPPFRAAPLAPALRPRALVAIAAAALAAVAGAALGGAAYLRSRHKPAPALATSAAPPDVAAASAVPTAPLTSSAAAEPEPAPAPAPTNAKPPLVSRGRATGSAPKARPRPDAGAPPPPTRTAEPTPEAPTDRK